GDALLLRGELHRVHDQVLERAPDERRIDGERRKLLAGELLDLDSLRRRRALHGRGGVEREHRELRGLLLQRKRAPLEALHFQDLVEQAAELLRAVEREVHAPSLVREPGRELKLQELEEARDSGERVPQVVNDQREEVLLQRLEVPQVLELLVND